MGWFGFVGIEEGGERREERGGRGLLFFFSFESFFVDGCVFFFWG